MQFSLKQVTDDISSEDSDLWFSSLIIQVVVLDWFNIVITQKSQDSLIVGVILNIAFPFKCTAFYYSKTHYYFFW